MGLIAHVTGDLNGLVIHAINSIKLSRWMYLRCVVMRDGQLPMRAYIVSDSEHETNIAVIAPDSLTAKKYGASELFDCDWIDLRVRSAVGANVSGLKEGVFEDLREALRIGIFHCIEDEYCDICGHEGIVRMLNNQIVCSGCFEEAK